MRMVVLGVDPGLTRLGWGSVSVSNDELSLGPCGLIAHPRDTDAPFNKYLDEGLAQLADKFPVLLSVIQPDFIAFETVPTGKLGSRSELVMSAASACKVMAHQWGIPWYNLGANTVKKIVA